MKKAKKKSGLRGWVFALILTAAFVILGGGYWMFRMSIGRAVYSTTVSFMKQIADHDHLNIVNQMNTKWEYLDSLLGRIKNTRSSSLEDFVYGLGVESKTTNFDKLYLITDDNQVYSSSYLEASLEEMPWGKGFQEASGNFVTRYSEDTREQWGEYLIYGKHLSAPVSCGVRKITGVVGLVSITNITSQMRLESFDGQGIAVVMRRSGEIITASQHYSSTDPKNFLTALEQADFKNGGSLKECRQAIDRGESLFIEYRLSGKDYYALFQPMDHHDGLDWYLVVQVSTQVTAKQVQTLVMRSLPFFLLLGGLILGVTYFIYRNMNETRIARASEQAKSAFLANMSHEIRTPLNGIVGIHYLMRQNLDNREKLEEYLTKADVSTGFLKSVISDVLDMSKIESGQLELYRSEMNLHSLIQEIEILLGTQAEESGLRFRVDCSGLCRPAVFGDSLRVKQVLTNLLGNALKFTPEGGEISLTVSQEVSDGMADTTFVISDTGCGMSPEFLERIWIPFEQERRVAAQNGTGLGTTLCKTLVEKMGGDITVESRQGEGTTFTVFIPFEAAGEEEALPVETASEDSEWTLKGKRILIVEDNEINRMIIVSIMEDLGCLITVAVDGQEAVKAFKEHPNYFFDLILMDIQMPVMNGYEATREIRSLPRPDSSGIPIIAMTANAFREDVEKALKSGMNDVATKPLDVALLLEKIGNLYKMEEM